ncbi:ABC1 kinase family protein [Sorangium sp. So ce1024]|uniref:ABC1 kinase family protein n=1 Tax=unclassified Sorangium TaxID=2621164 RepID=UPI003F01599B
MSHGAAPEELRSSSGLLRPPAEPARAPSTPPVAVNEAPPTPAGAAHHAPPAPPAPPAGAAHHAPPAPPAGAAHHAPPAPPAGAAHHAPPAPPAGAAHHAPPAARSDAPPRPSPAAPRSFRQNAAQSGRFIRAYLTTFTVLASYLWFSFLRRLLGDAWAQSRVDEVHARNARRIERTIVELQGLFIKVGQMLSIMANFLPATLRAGLEGLQDQVPPRPYEEIAARIADELGRPIEQLFARFHKEPLASASLGQVHEAWLLDGTRVAVKVQHRDIDEIVRLDLLTIRRIMAIVGKFVPVQGLDAYYHQIRSMILEELDFVREARNITRIAENFANQPQVRFPTPIAPYCTRRVMTTTFVEGIKVGDLAALEAHGVDRKALARQIVQVFCQQIFVDGVYHADPHPGNMLVGPGGELILLDFGAVAELSKEMREGIPEFLEAVIRRDTDGIIKTLRKMGFLSRRDTVDVSERVVEFFHQRFQDEVKLESFNLKDIKIDPQRGIESLIDLRRMNIGLKELSGAFHVPRDFVLLERTLILLTGVCTQLDPELNPMDVVRPYVQDFVLGNRDWAQIALEAAKDMGIKALTIPDDLRKYLTRANRGEAEVKIRGLAQAASLVYTGVRQLIYAALAIAAGFAGLQLYLAGHAALARYCLYGAAAAGVLLAGSLLFTNRG